MDATVAEAKRAFALQEYERATELFADACGEYSEEHDGEENPDLLFSYGQSLFRLAVRNASLVNSDEVEKKQLPLENAHVSLAPDVGEEEQPKDATQEQNDDEEDDEEEDDDFKAAWKIIDLCRVLFQQKGDDAKLADTYALLGDIAIEDDNYPQATEDFRSALELKQDLFARDDRKLAEATYMLALSEELSGDKQASLEHMRAAAKLTRNYDEGAAKELEQRAHDIEAELKSTSGDSKVQKAAADIAGREAIASALTQILSGASDISTIARKRKRPEDASAAKKPNTSK